MAYDERTFRENVKRQKISIDTYTMADRKDVRMRKLTKQEELKS